MTHRISPNRTTVLWIWAPCSTAFCVPALSGEPAQALILFSFAFVITASTSVSLCATIEIDSGDRLTIRYLVHSFSDRLENLQVEASSKFDFRRDDRLGVKRLYQGTRLPCFKVGWFVPKNGAVAFVCVSRKRRARALRTRDGCYILVDPRIARWIQVVANSRDATRRQ